MMGQMVFRNVVHRPVRTVVSILAVAVQVTLVIIVVGLTSGMMQDAGKRIEGIGADIMLQPPSAQVFIAFSGAPMPIKLGDKLREIKYIQSYTPVLFYFNLTGGVDILYGIDPDSFRDVSGGFVFLSGHDMQGPYDMLADDVVAQSKHLTVGSTFRMLDHDFNVAGIVEHGKGARIFVQLSTLQDLTASPDKTSVFFIKCTRPDRTAAVMDEMHDIFRGYQIRPLKDYLSLMTQTSLPGLDAFVRSMIALAVAIGFLVIFLCMYTTVIERTRDIGVLKSIGASKGYIVKAILGETLLICGIGIVAGVLLSYLTRAAFESAFPTIHIDITISWIIRAAVISIVASLLGGTYPSYLASGKDPVEALAYD
jgi:putative ABC transport system permease protein